MRRFSPRWLRGLEGALGLMKEDLAIYERVARSGRPTYAVGLDRGERQFPSWIWEDCPLSSIKEAVGQVLHGWRVARRAVRHGVDPVEWARRQEGLLIRFSARKLNPYIAGVEGPVLAQPQHWEGPRSSYLNFLMDLALLCERGRGKDPFWVSPAAHPNRLPAATAAEAEEYEEYEEYEEDWED